MLLLLVSPEKAQWLGGFYSCEEQHSHPCSWQECLKQSLAHTNVLVRLFLCFLGNAEILWMCRNNLEKNWSPEMELKCCWRRAACTFQQDFQNYIQHRSWSTEVHGFSKYFKARRTSGNLATSVSEWEQNGGANQKLFLPSQGKSSPNGANSSPQSSRLPVLGKLSLVWGGKTFGGMDSGAGGKWKVLSTSHGNNAVKIGFVLVLKVFHIKFYQVHALTPASL